MSKQSAKQEHLITPMGFVLLVIVIAALLFMLYPSKEALFSGERSSNDLKTLFKDPAKLKYEKLLHQPSVTAREVLDTVGYLSEKGLWKEYRHLLVTKLPNKLSDDERKESALWMLQSHLDEYYISQNEHEKFERPLAQAREQLQRFDELEQLSIPELRLLAQSSLEFGLIPQAIQTYFRLAEIDVDHRLTWLDKAGSKAMQIEYYADAVNAYKQATSYSKSNVEYKTYLYAWLNAATKSGNIAMVQNIVEGIESDLPNDPAELKKLATISLEIGRPSIAHRIYAQLAIVDSKNAKQWFEKAGIWALSNKEHQQAANYFAEAEKLTSQPHEIERLKYRQYEALIAGEMPKKALDKVKALVDKHADDSELLKNGINTSLAAKDSQTARKWNKRYLNIHPNDMTALLRQTDIEIRDKQYEQALLISRKILSIQPNNIKNRQTLAFLQESRGNNIAALHQWQAINMLDPKHENQTHILRLAQATINQGEGLRLLLRLNQQQKLPEQAIQDMATYYYKKKKEEKAAHLINNYVKKYRASRELWKRLASLQKNKPQQALATWQTIERKFGSNDESVLARLEILWNLDRKAEALQTYKNNPNVAISTHFQHQILAELGWEFAEYDLALQHYHYLLKTADASCKKANNSHCLKKSNNAKVAYYQRISSIYLKRGDTNTAMHIFRKAWQDTHNSDILLQALQLSFSNRLNIHLSYFLKVAIQNEQLFVQNVSYWQLQAQLASKAQQYEKAQQYYQKMLTIQPDSIPAKRGIIWVLIQTKQKDKLRKTLTKWKTVAAKEEQLWVSYALGLQALDEVRDSLPWYKHYIDKNQHDFAMLLSYADQLDRLDRKDSAYRIRRFALHNLRRYLRKHTISDEQRKEALFQYLGVVQRYGKLAAFEKLYQQLHSDYNNTADATRLNEIAIAWMLGTKQDDKARYQLIKAHEQRLKTPLWQLLAIAIKNKDKKGIDKLLANSDKLSLENRVSALLTVGKEKRAYYLALKGIDEKRLPKEREQARQLALSVADDYASSLEFELKQKRLGNLDLQSEGIIYRQGMKPDFPFGYDLAIRKHRLNYDDFTANETDASARIHWKNENNRVDVSLGINHRKEGNLYYTQLEYQHEFSDKLNASIEFGKNEVANEGALLRMIGKRDRIKAGINTKIGKQNYASVSAWQQGFSTRDGEDLASGHGVSASIIHKENIGSSQWHIGAQAQAESNQVAENLPTGVMQQLGTSNSIIAKNPKSAGLLAGISHGSPGQGVPKVNSPRYSANAWLGKSSTTDKLGLNVEASVGSRILGNDELSATAFVNTISGSNGQRDQGITLQYRKWFDTGLDNERYRIEQ